MCVQISQHLRPIARACDDVQLLLLSCPGYLRVSRSTLAAARIINGNPKLTHQLPEHEQPCSARRYNKQQTTGDSAPRQSLAITESNQPLLLQTERHSLDGMQLSFS
jgi:hypothetical protein